MATKKKKSAEATPQWYFPTLGKTVSAATYEEALALATEEKEQEEGNGGL